jgi:hypothetical protein
LIVSYTEAAYEALSDEQLQELLEQHERFSALQGYYCLQPERTRNRGEIVVVVYVDSHTSDLVNVMPPFLAGLKVVVKADDPRTGDVRIVQRPGAD